MTLNFAAVILAAGRSTRMGKPKQLLRFKGQTMLEHAISAALGAGITTPVVVIGAYADSLLEEVQLLRYCKVLRNDDFAEGQSTSLRAGTSFLSGKYDAAIFMLADQPLVDSALVLNLSNEFSRVKPDVLYPVYQGRRGNPVIIGANLFPRLINISGDEGARSLFTDQSLKIHAHEVDNEAVVTDIDTWQDYTSLFKSKYL